MKDMYCFAQNDEENMDFYNKAQAAYMNVFKRVGLGDITYITSASGGVFTDKFSHEFQTICEAGEDIIYVNKEQGVAVNEEVFNTETLDKMGMKESDFEKVKAAEVGNIFNFGTKKSEDLELYFSDKEGEKKPVFLSSYGIGVTRLMGVLVEVNAGENGMVWPSAVAPFDIHLVEIPSADSKVKEKAEKIYAELREKHEVLYDDREARAGEKFADADLIGIPLQIIVSERGLEGDVVELKNRQTGETREVQTSLIDEELAKV